MLRRMALFTLTFAALIVAAAPTDARSQQRQNQNNPIPFSHSPCSVLNEGPCTPYFCSALQPGPCIPEIDYPIGENLQLTILSKPDDKDAAKYVKPDHDLDTIGDLFAALRSCWTPPPENEAREGMQMSVKFSFKRDGGLIGQPRVTYATDGVPAQTRNVYLGAIKEALTGCTPLALSGGLGGAIAGRPIMIRYVDNRSLSQTPQKQ
jgi:hypothetical protein